MPQAGSARRRVVEATELLVPGPWVHRWVSANGVTLHVTEAGEGPLVVLLHGFPSFWWSWHRQLVSLAAAGFRAVAPDLRGYGASDKPPRGYDAPTLAADVAALVRALGERDAVIVGHDWGGELAWTVGAMQPAHARAVAAVAAPHPLRWLPSLARDATQRRHSSYMARFQLPWHPERWLVTDDAVNVEGLLRAWGGPSYPDPETARRNRDAMQILYVPNRAMEYYRWAVRSIPRADGRAYRAAMAAPVTAPVLQVHGALDGCIEVATAAGSQQWAAGRYEWLVMDGVGHFPHEEAPEEFDAALLAWLRALEQ